MVRAGYGLKAGLSPQQSLFECWWQSADPGMYDVTIPCESPSRWQNRAARGACLLGAQLQVPALLAQVVELQLQQLHLRTQRARLSDCRT